ncbi:helix-hairpin-helix domain-containing protein [Dokdonia sinensis]|uniref:Helix-hairpin-helix domain-containing protein n=1 Tax=Dokdonia sinensis TaxID=2479847 RepID=A0A3M0FU00_9FLAO|nr:helix-hairpin-helix domain-containing protein [Dokdonia sinensis]RMB56280.1 helix-hairpin-helix domain-containing protein [Dokdonia sinensis]
MHKFKSHFVYDTQKRSGILILLTIILIALGFAFWYEPSYDIALSPEEAQEIQVFQQRIDSLKGVEIENRKPKVYPFNPNFITDYKGYTLGMSTLEIDRLHRFRESDKWINSIADFKRVTQVSDSLLNKISPYFKFPDWVTNPKTTTSYSSKRTWKTTEEKGDINTVTLAQLEAIEGVDAQSAHKILKYRNKIGGFIIYKQVYDVYDVPYDTKRAILDEYTVQQVPVVSKLNVNTASASDLSTVPMLSFELAMEIVNYRTLREGITSIEELAKIDGMTSYKFERIKLYLNID